MTSKAITTPTTHRPASKAPTLFSPIKVGAVEAPNRIFMAPMTRGRATQDHVPTEIMAEYYAQRASAGLIISEAIGVSPEGLGWPFAPGLYTKDMVKGWKNVTDRVHSSGGRIFAQLWHMGRLSHPSFWGGDKPVSASATLRIGECHTYDGKRPYVEARELATQEIPTLIKQFADAAENAMDAGFDGVQLHAANGYLIDQFLRDSSNQRQDQYGGPIENRIRFLVETTQSVVSRVGADRSSVRLSPNGESQGIDDSNQDALFTAAARALSPMNLAFLELRDVGPHGTFGSSDRLQVAPLIRRVYDGPLILNADYTPATAQHTLDIGLADAISWARYFICNRDLPQRFKDGNFRTQSDMSTWYSQGPEGYIDYD
ncbi:alkene reductase [Henriciella sp. AS95]|uniref:alkene reductase n=1 Tax=Henriciella sp. AS95 TaxID=3135782 RepID=UPI003172C741